MYVKFSVSGGKKYQFLEKNWINYPVSKNSTACILNLDFVLASTCGLNRFQHHWCLQLQPTSLQRDELLLHFFRSFTKYHQATSKVELFDQSSCKHSKQVRSGIIKLPQYDPLIWRRPLESVTEILIYKTYFAVINST